MRPFAVRAIPRATLGTAWRAYTRARDAGEDPVLLAYTSLVGVVHSYAVPIAIDGQRAHLLLDMYNEISDRIDEVVNEDGLTRAAATNQVLDGVRRDLAVTANYFSALSFPLVVYRGLLVPLDGPRSGRLMRAQAQGDSWTPNRAIAEAFATGTHDASEVTHAGLGGRGRSVLLEGTIRSPGGVDWRQTISLFHGYSLGVLGDDRQAEEEIRIGDRGSVCDVHEIPLEGA